MKSKQIRRRTIRLRRFGNDWYDLFEDWSLIESSFATQYHIRLRNDQDMTWAEFCTLLSGLMPETPLGQVVAIRSEENEDRLKNFTPEQRKIRDEWRIKILNKQHKEVSQMSENEKMAQVKKIQEMFKRAFSK